MKREDVKGIVPNITEEQLQQIMDLHSSDIGSHKQSIDTLKAERDAARTQLADANKKLEGYDPEWKTKADQARQQAEQQVAEMKAGYAATSAASSLKFTSDSAKKAFLADLNARTTAPCWVLTTMSHRTRKATPAPSPKSRATPL